MRLHYQIKNEQWMLAASVPKGMYKYFRFWGGDARTGWLSIAQWLARMREIRW